MSKMLSSREREAMKTRSAVMYNKNICSKIFSYLSTKDLANCRLVCTFWNHVIFQLDNYFVVAVYEQNWDSKSEWKIFYKPQKSVKLFLDESANLAGCSTFIFTNVRYRTLDYLASVWEPDESKPINAIDVLMKFKEFTQNVTSIKVQSCDLESETSLVLFIGSFPQLKCMTVSGKIEFKCRYEPTIAILNGTYSFPDGKNSSWQLKKFRAELDGISSELLFMFRYLLLQNCELEELNLKLNSIQDNYMAGGSLLSQLLTTSMATLKKVVIDLNYLNSGISMFPSIFGANLGHRETALPLEYLEIRSEDLKYDSNLARLFPWILSLNNLKEIRLSSLTLNENFPLEAFEEIMRKGCVIKLDAEVVHKPSDLLQRITSSAALKKMLRTIEFYQANYQDEEGLFKYFKTSGFNQTHSLSLMYSVVGAPNGTKWGLPADILSKIFSHLTNLFVRGKGIQFCDNDLQLILQHLIHMEKLNILCELNAVTDFGTTGRKEGRPATGISFSNLKQLRVVCLWNIGKHITNATLNHGFKELKQLTQVYLCGNSEITMIGKLRFKQEHKNVEVHACNKR